MIRSVRVLLLLLLALATTFVVQVPAEAASFAVSRTAVVSGETVRFTGSLGAQPRRAVVLQRKAGARWVKVASARSARSGAFAFSVRATGAAGTTRAFRVQAPKAGARKARTTVARTIRFVGQTVSLQAPANVTTGKQFNVTATFGPARPGRVVVLQRGSGATWTEVARRTEDGGGRAAFPVTLVPTGAASLRAVALATGGAPAANSSARTVTVLPPALQRMSESQAGVVGDAYANYPAVSADGRYVAFSSEASNLVPDDTNGTSDVFVRDVLAGTIERVSVSSDEQQGVWPAEVPSISADGRYVSFQSSSQLTADQSSTQNIFVRDRVAGTTIRVTAPKPGDVVPSNNSYQSSISADGRYVAFASLANNLVANDTNAKADIFLRDLVAGTTVRVSVDNDGNQSNDASRLPKISADGTVVAYESNATNLVAGDTNGQTDVFRWVRANSNVLRASQSDTVESNGLSYLAGISADGRFVAITSYGNGLVAGDDDNAADAFRWDAQTLGLELVSRSSTGVPATGDSYASSISADGRLVAFTSYDVLAPGDTNSVYDVHVRDLVLGTTRRVSDTVDGAPSNGESSLGVLAADGTAIAFVSQATNLVPGADTNAANDVFVRDLTR